MIRKLIMALVLFFSLSGCFFSIGNDGMEVKLGQGDYEHCERTVDETGNPKEVCRKIGGGALSSSGSASLEALVGLLVGVLVTGM